MSASVSIDTMGEQDWTFYHDHAKEWLALHGPGIYLHAPFDKPFRVEQFPWELPFTCDGVGGWINSYPSCAKFSATDEATGLRFRWSVDIYDRHQDGIEVDSAAIAALIARCSTPPQAKALRVVLDEFRAKIDERVAEHEKWLATARGMRSALDRAMEWRP